MKLNVARGFKPGTMISTVEVPPELRIKRTSGIDWIDDAMGGCGGFTPTSTLMLTGGPGAGKSTLLRQLADSLTKAGHIVFYNCGEESIYQCKMSIERLRLKNDFMVGEERMLPKVYNFLDNVKAQNPGKQIFFLQDSLQTLDDGKYVDSHGESRGTTGKTPGYCAEMMVDWSQQNYAVTIFICQVTKNGDFAGANKIRHAIDIHANMFVDEKEKSDTYGCLLFEVTKNRWGKCGTTYILGLTETGLEERGSFKKAGF